MNKVDELTPLPTSQVSTDEATALNEKRLQIQAPTGISSALVRPLFSPLGRRTELVHAYPELDAVCTRLGFGPDLTLSELSASPDWALLILARAARPPLPPPARDWSMATIPEVIADIITTHHVPLRHELERLEILIDHLNDANPHANIVALRTEFLHSKAEITLHIDQEESELFPLCVELEDALCGRIIWNDRDITAHIRYSGHGHAENESGIQRILDQVQIAAINFKDPDVTIFQIGVEALARDLDIHSAKEGNILIPAAIFSEEQLRARTTKRLHDGAL